MYQYWYDKCKRFILSSFFTSRIFELIKIFPQIFLSKIIIIALMVLLPFGAFRAEMLFIELRLNLLNWGESSYFLIGAKAQSVLSFGLQPAARLSNLVASPVTKL